MFRLAALLLLVAMPVFGQPSVTSVNGTLDEGESIIIGGTGFGTKGVAAPAIWDYLSNIAAYSGLGDEDEIPTGTGYPWTGSQGHASCNLGGPVYKTTDTRAQGRPYYRFKKVGYLHGQDYGGSEPRVVMVDWWIRQKNRAVGQYESSSKLIRVWPAGSAGSGSISWTQMHLTYSRDIEHDCYVNSGTGTHNPDWWGRYVIDQWIHNRIIVDSRGDVSCGYGRVVTSANNTHTDHDLSDVFSERGPINMLYKIGIGHSVPGNFSCSEYWDLSEIYVDTTMSRACIGDASSWSSVSHYEMLIPTAWSNTQITATVNNGSFITDDSVWIYVFNRNGDPDPTGYSATIGEIIEDDPQLSAPGQPVLDLGD